MRRSLAITIGALGVIWLAAIAVQLFFVAGLAPIAALIGAIVAQIAVFLVASALLLVTNTRRPAGIDPNAPLRPRDPFGASTDDLLRPAVMVGAQPYGRRHSDDANVVHRLIDRLEKDDAARPTPASAPQWALDLQQNHETATGLFPDPLPEDS